MTLPRYPEYRGSSIPWIGDVPATWKSHPLFTVACERLESNVGMLENNLLSLSYGRIVRKNIDSNDGLLPASFETYQIVRPGDIVLRLTDLQNDKRSLRSARVEEQGIITSAYLALEPFQGESRFLAYLLRAYDLAKVFYSMGGGLRQSMKFADMRRMPVLLPSPREQADIVAFLDRETAKIDALVVEQERLVALLAEKRQATTSKAVARGLKANVQMTDSGIPWLGQIPEHWKTHRLKYVCRVQTGDKDTVDATIDGDFPFFVRSQKIERISSYTHDCEAVLTAGDGAGVGKVFHYYKGCFDFHQRVYMLNNFKYVTGRFVFMYLSTMFHNVALDGVAKSTVDSLRMPVFLNFVIASPPQNEQIEILEFIDSEIARFDALMFEVEQGINLLKERRSALIAAAVTGQIDVRGKASGRIVEDELAA